MTDRGLAAFEHAGDFALVVAGLAEKVNLVSFELGKVRVAHSRQR